MKAKGLQFGRTGYRKRRLIGKLTLKAEVKCPKTHTRLEQGGVGGNTCRSPMDHLGGQSVALDLFHQAAWGRSSECALRNVFSSGSTAHLPHLGGDNRLS